MLEQASEHSSEARIEDSAPQLVTLVSPFPDVHSTTSGTTGLTWYSKSLVDNLIAQGQSVEVWASDETADSNPGTEKSAGTNAASLTVKRNWHRGFLGTLRLVREILIRRPKLIHIQQEFNMFGGAAALLVVPFIPLAARFVGAKLVTTMHGGFGKKDLTPEYVAENGIVAPVWVIKCIFNYVFGAFARLSHHVIVHESWQKEQLLEEYAVISERLSVIPIGVPKNEDAVSQHEARELLKISSAAKVYLFMGFAAKYKGLPQLVDAAEELFARDPEALLVIGAGMAPRLAKNAEYVGWYQALAERAQSLSPRLRWVGFIPNHHVALYYASADICVFPYTRRLAASGPLALAFGFKKAVALSNSLKGIPGSVFKFETEDSELLEKSQLSWDQTSRLTLGIYVQYLS